VQAISNRWPRERDQRIALIGLLVLLILGALVRLGWMYAIRPAIVGYSDEISYMNLANGDLWSDPTREVGYPLFLRLVGHVIEPLSGIILLQHALGLATGVILFATVRRIGGPQWLGLLPAAVVMLNGTEAILEHMVLTEALFIFVLAGAVYCAVRTSQSDGDWRWAAATGVLFGVAATVRVVGLPLLLVVVPWVAFMAARSHRVRLLRTAAVVVGAAAVLGPYVISHHAARDHWGVGPRAGIWNLYARVAPFADCRRFTPPPGTERLCEATPPEQRTTAVEEYNYAPHLSPADQLWGVNGYSDDPAVNKLLGQWTRQVIIHQPWDYFRTVVEGVGAYIVRTRLVFANRHGIGAPYEHYYRVSIWDPVRIQGAIAGPLTQYYDTRGLLQRQDWVERMLDYEEYTRMKGPHMFVLMSLSVFALFLPRGHPRRMGTLLFGLAWMSLVIPPATHWWDARAAIVPLGPLAATAALGAWQLGRWAARLRRGRVSAAAARG